MKWLTEALAYKHLFPCIILALYTGAMVRYAAAGEWSRVAYWFAASQITVVSTWLLKR